MNRVDGSFINQENYESLSGKKLELGGISTDRFAA
jgi:hypothetical protein